MVTQEWLQALVSGVMAGGFAAGAASVRIQRQRFEFDQQNKAHPLKYIIDAKQKLEQPPA